MGGGGGAKEGGRGDIAMLSISLYPLARLSYVSICLVFVFVFFINPGFWGRYSS